jgi:hypothetical protein
MDGYSAMTIGWEVKSGRKMFSFKTTQADRVFEDQGKLFIYDKDNKTIMIFNNWDWVRTVKA